MNRTTLSERLRVVLANRSLLRRRLRSTLGREKRSFGFESLEERALLATITWDGGAGTFNFGDANNWDSNTIPGLTDDAVIPDLAGTPTIVVAGTRSVRSLSSSELIGMSSGSLTLQNNSSFNSGMSLSGGSLNVASGAVLSLAGTSQLTGTAALGGLGEYRNLGSMTLAAADITFNGVLRNQGTMTQNSGQLILGNTGQWINEVTGVFNAGATGGVIAAGNGGWIVRNFGTIQHSSGTFAINFLDNRGVVQNIGGSLSTYSLDNSGSIFVQAGLYDITGQNLSNNFSGRIDASAGASVTFTSPQIQMQAGTRFSGTGTFNLTGGFYNVWDAVTIDPGTTLSMTSGAEIQLAFENSVISGGTISISTGTFGIHAGGGFETHINSNLQWSSGNLSIDQGSKLTLGGTTTWSGSGNITGGGILRNEGSFTYSPAAARTLVSTIENAGTFLDPSSFAIVLNPGARIDNLATGVFNMQNTLATPITAAGSGTHIFNNYGEFRKSSTGTSTLNSAITFNSFDGTLNGQQGTLVIAGAGSRFAGLNFAGQSGATVQVTATSTTSIVGTVTGSGGVSAIITGTSSAVISVEPSGLVFNVTTPNLLAFQAYTDGGKITVAAGSYLKVGGLSHALANNIDVLGTMTRVGNGTAFSVQSPGSLNVQPGGVFVSNATGNSALFQGTGQFNIYGTIRKISTDNTTFGSPNFNLLGGLIDVQAGTMSIGGTAGTFENAQFSASAGTTLTLTGAQTWRGTFTGSGTGIVNKSGSLNIDASGVTFNFPAGLFNLSSTMTVDGGALTVAPGSYLGSIFGTKVFLNQIDIYGTVTAPTTSSLGFLIDFPSVLTVKPSGLISVTGTNNQIGFGGLAGSTIGRVVNQGTIKVNANSALSITPGLDSPGVSEVLSGATLTIGTSVAQLPVTTLLGGTWNVSGTLTFPPGSSPVGTLGPGATVTLNGASASFGKMESSQFTRNEGNLTIKGGKSFTTFRQFSNIGTLTVEAGSSLNVPNTNPSPNYTQTGGSTVLVGGSISAPLMTLSGGALTGTGTVTTNLTNSGGTVGPGASPGKITINGNYTQGAAGTLSIDVGGTNAATPDFDQLTVTGTANLDGTLNVSAINDFLPSKGETFRFMTFASRTGDFSIKNLAPYQGYALFGTNVGANFYDLNSLNIIVRNTNDTGVGSFRQAILDANAASDSDNILFHIPGPGPFTIAPLSALPTITQPVMIDGYAQIAATRNTLAVGNNAVLKVQLDGSNIPAALVAGLDIAASNTTVQGLVINRFTGRQIQISGSSATNDVIIGNFIGTDLLGSSALQHPSATSLSAGIAIDLGSHHNRIGTDGNGLNDAAERNVIAGNFGSGIEIIGLGSDFNIIAGNYIGATASGMTLLGNGNAGQLSAGIAIRSGARSNRVGTDASDDPYNTNERNIIAGQVNGSGVAIENLGTDSNVVAGNYIGLSADGLGALPNSFDGISIGGAGLLALPTSNRIGSNGDGVRDEAERNVIAGNLRSGIRLEGAHGNLLSGNDIGLKVGGVEGLGNHGDGITVIGSANTQIGGSAVGASNVISGNLGSGIRITFPTSTNNLIVGNFIGTDRNASIEIGNIADGVTINGSGNNSIGGTAVGFANVISGNHGSGVSIQGATANQNLVQGNRIGTNALGTVAIANGINGVTLMAGAHDNDIGGNTDGAGNTISGNTESGVQLDGVGTTLNRIRSNRIGVSASGDVAIPNGADGIVLTNGATQNRIGGETVAERNIISGNLGSGVRLSGTLTSNNEIEGNFIGVDALGNTAIANHASGIHVAAASNNFIGGIVDGSQNVISGNLVAGIHISDGAFSNIIRNNFVGTDASGIFAVGNAVGVLVDSGAMQNNIGSDSLHPNVISGNTTAGVRLSGAGTQQNTIKANYIGIGENGDSIVSNSTGVLVDSGAESNIIGGGIPADGNIISGNSGDGIWITGANTGDLFIAFNSIGTNSARLQDRGNSGSGIRIENGASIVNIVENTISGNGRDGVEVLGPNVTSVVIDSNRIGLDATGSLLVGNDRYGIFLGEGVVSPAINLNVISGNSAGVGSEATGTMLTANLIGANASGLNQLGNRRGSGNNTEGHYGILSSGENVQIGSSGFGNIVVGHDVGIWIRNATSSGNVVDNRVGTDAAGLLSLPNTIGIRLSEAADGVRLSQNTIANSLTSGLRLLDDTSNHNTFTQNRYFGNIGPAIDAGIAGVTINDLNDVDGVLNFPVLEWADIVEDNFVVKGYVRAGGTAEFYVSTPTVNGIGQGSTFVGSRTEGVPAGDDFDASPGSYGPVVRGALVGSDAAERFEFRFPLNSLPPELRYGSLITAVAVGSTSEFGNAIPIGDAISRLAPVITLPAGVTLVQGENLQVQGSFPRRRLD
ncbi:MAG: hypothetical protein U0930_19965 [Pirellulales bacterium]